jgi:small subunit ribosomal protein S17
MKKIGIKGVEAPEQECEDPNCPWHGKLSIRGRVFEGIVKSAKMERSAIIEWERLHYLRKYERYERKRTRVTAHNPPCIAAKGGERVKIAECRPLSKTKKFVIIAKLS